MEAPATLDGEEGSALYKVILVDDEYYIRQHLKSCIDWETHGFRIVGEAENGQDALELLTRDSVELAVVDISMPGQNGLALIQALKDRHIATKIIILSGYGTFEYAQKAIEFGVTQYLLKPIDEQALMDCLEQMKGILRSEQAIRQISDSQQHTEAMMQAVKKDHLFKRILTGRSLSSTSSAELEAQLARYGLAPGAEYLTVVYDFENRARGRMPSGDHELFQYGVNNILGEMATPCFEMIDATDNYGHCVLVCSLPTQGNVHMDGFVNQALDIVNAHLNVDLRVGISCPFQFSLDNLIDGYHRALACYSSCCLYGCRYVVEEPPAPRYPGLFEVGQALEKIETHASLGKEAGLCEAIAHFFSLLQKQVYPFVVLEQQISRLLLICCSSTLLGDSASSLSYLTECREFLYAGYDFDRIQEKIQQLFLSVFMVEQSHPPGDPKVHLVEEATQFIQAHYMRNDLSLTVLSQNLLISPSYLSSIFKKVQGISINQHITRLRMQKAKELLENRNLTLTEIAEQVGYSDLFYFSKLFKRFYGASPSKYRNSVLARQHSTI